MQANPPLAIVDTADGSRMLVRCDLDEGYHSRRGARTEARHVFLAGSGAAQRAATGKATAIIEVGLGSGLNALVTAETFAAAGTPLHYVGLESAPVAPQHLDALGYGAETAHGRTIAAWLRRFATADSNDGHCTCTELPGLSLTAIRTDALSWTPATGADIVYLDAFSPASAPELWTADALARWCSWLRPGGVLVTYCAQGEFRRHLRALGLQVERLAGPPGGKREMTRATLPGSAVTQFG
jgi:tRNA U34 5-methylaminomethyl-2-thiouridine-forming methyltransferase MnmC